MCGTKTDEDQKLRAVGIAPFIWLHHPVDIALDDADEKREQRGGSRSEISRGGARRVRIDQLPRPRSVRRKSNDTRGRGIVTLSRIYAR